MHYSSVFTVPPNIPVPAWDLRSVNASLSEAADRSGSSPSPDKGQRFTLQSRSESNQELPGNRASVLLVEDNPADATLVRKALEEHGITGHLTVFVDGEKAIDFIRALDTQPLQRPDLVIIDFNLPRRPGREVLQSLRRSERGRNVPAIVLSSSDAQDDKEDAARFGATRYLRKPSRLDEFLGLGAIFKATLGTPLE